MVPHWFGPGYGYALDQQQCLQTTSTKPTGIHNIYSIWEQGRGVTPGKTACETLAIDCHLCSMLAIYGLTIYTAPYIMFLNRAVRGQVGGGFGPETFFWALKWLPPKDVAPGGVGEGGALVLRNMIERAHRVHVEVGRLPLSQLCNTTPQPSVVNW
jgi:hypothetical protein